ncbi:F0F1 ATP synthase subunit delta [Candidatus Gottesmanbacteria bacterium]|nr:F0F1 ATP synthase subunit delta [Candidatus Gottesmanbacteria bacterium]
MSSLSKDARGFVDGVVSYLSHGEKSSALPKVATLLHKVTSQAKRQKSARVESCIAMVSNERSNLERILARVLGHSVDVEYSVNASLLGGFRVQVADWIIDTSLSSQLALLMLSMNSER